MSKITAMPVIKNEQANLTQRLIDASVAYYSGAQELMNDAEFDREVEHLREMEQESGIVYEGSPTTFVGAKDSDLPKVIHEYPALSLNKVKYAEREKLNKWCNGKDVLITWKLDGLTIVATYDDGKLVLAASRGEDGIEGSNITAAARFIKGIPKEIPYKGHLVVRGEATMSYKEFERVNEEAGGIYKTPRNIAAATVLNADTTDIRHREIQFYGFKLITPLPEAGVMLPQFGKKAYSSQYEWDRLEWLSSIGIQSVADVPMMPIMTRIDGGVSIREDIEDYREQAVNNQVPTDGLVISYNDQVYAASLGDTGHHPRGSIALKWTDETEETTIRNVDWSVGKTGVITPVAVFDPVTLGAGSTVARASMHNLSIMEKMPETGKEDGWLPLEIGAKAQVYLANMIIPQIRSITKGTARVQVPDKCPVCGSPTSVRESDNGIRALYCMNPMCTARRVNLLMNTFSNDGLFVKGLGESQIEDLLSAKLVNGYPVSFYRLREKTAVVSEDGSTSYPLPDSLKKKDGWGQKKWENLLNAIDASRKTNLQKFLYSLNVPLLGHDLSKKLTKLFKGGIAEFLAFVKYPDETWLMDQDGIGYEKSRNIWSWCVKTADSSEEWAMLTALIDELEFEAPKAEAEASLAGKTFVITGAVHSYKNRDEFKASVEARGGKVAGSVSKKTDFLVNNDITSTSGKNAKAKKLGIPIISEDEFIERFGK